MRLLFLVFITVYYNNYYSQDNNYWNQMPGSNSALLGGAVVGGVRDNSAIFYNPGALALIDSATISIAANSFQYEIENIFNGGGKGVDYSSKKFQTIPLVTLSGSFKIKPNSKSTFGFMVFTKNQTSNSFSKRVDDSLNWKSVLYGYDTSYYESNNPKIGYIGDFNMRTGLNETWIGFGYAYKINKHISLGLTPFIAYRTQFYSKSFESRVALDPMSNYANPWGVSSIGYSDVSNISSSNIRALAKIGAAFDFDNLKIGISYTSQSFNLGGKTLISRDITYHGGQADPTFTLTGFGPPILGATFSYAYNLNDRQEGLKTTYKSPFSIAGGAKYSLKNTTLHVTAEYFARVETYNIITPDSTNFYRSGLISPNGTNSIITSAKSNEYLKIVDASKEVFNYSFAIEQNLNKRFIKALNLVNPKLIQLDGMIISASYRTDLSSYKKVSNDFWVYKYGFGDTTYTVGQSLSFSNVNLKHINLGFTFQRKKSDLHLGFCYSYGFNQNFQALNNLANPKDNVISNNLGAVPNFLNSSNYYYKSYSLLVGYTYHIK